MVAERAEEVLEPVAEEGAVRVGQGKFGRRAEEVARKHLRVRRVEAGVLVGPAEERGRVTHVVLVERPLVRDQDREGRPARPAGPPGLLPGRRDRAGVPGDHDRVEPAHVDPELERVRGHDAAEPTLLQPPLDCPPLLREVPGPVGRDEVRFRDGLAGPGPDQLGALPGGGEAEGLEAVLDAVDEEPLRLGERRPLSGGGGVVEHELAGALRRPALRRPARRAARSGSRRTPPGSRASRSRGRRPGRRRGGGRPAGAGGGGGRCSRRRPRGTGGPRPRPRPGGPRGTGATSRARAAPDGAGTGSRGRSGTGSGSPAGATRGCLRRTRPGRGRARWRPRSPAGPGAGRSRAPWSGRGRARSPPRRARAARARGA